MTTNYTTKEKIESLLALGDLSILDETPEKCYAYHRDGGEELNEPRLWENREELATKGFSCTDAEYVYLFSGGIWLVAKYGEKTWEPVLQSVQIGEETITEEIFLEHLQAAIKRDARKVFSSFFNYVSQLPDDLKDRFVFDHFQRDAFENVNYLPF